MNKSSTPFERNMIAMYGIDGQKWLDNIPSLVAKIAKDHNISGICPFENLTYNFVAHGTLEDRDIVLKISLNPNDLKRQGRVLEAFRGLRSIQLLQSEPGMLLMERAIQGTSLKEYFPDRDGVALEICCQCIESLQKCPETPLSLTGVPSVQEWFSALKTQENALEETGSFERTLSGSPDIEYKALAKKAFALSEELFSPRHNLSVKLLHGDLHHDNIVENGESWVAIDPQGVWGPVEYEVAAFLFNPLPMLLESKKPAELRAILQSRICAFSQRLSLSSKHLAQFAFCKAILCATWALEDGGSPRDFLTLATIFESLIEPE